VKLRSVAVAVGLAMVAAGSLVALAWGADPSAIPSAAPVVVLEGGDLRSDGAGPGLVGNPLLILGAVVALGVATAVVTFAVARLTRPR